MFHRLAAKHLNLIFIAIYALLGSWVMMSFMLGSEFGGTEYRSIDMALKRQNYMPLFPRALLPWTANAILALIPDIVREPLTQLLIAVRDSNKGMFVIGLRYKNGGYPVSINDTYIFNTMTMMALVAITLGLFIYMMHRLGAVFFPQSPAYAFLAPIPILLVIPPFASLYAYIYDFAELFFSCLLFYLLYQQRWRAYLIALALATLNKETSLFIIVFYFIWGFQRLPAQQFWRLGIFQLVIFFGIRQAMAVHYSILHPEAGVNLYIYLHALPAGVQFIYGYNFYNFMMMVAGAFFLLYRWPEKPTYLKMGVWIMIANFVAYIITCHPGEYRDLYFGMPVFFLLFAHSFVRLTDMDQWDIFKDHARLRAQASPAN